MRVQLKPDLATGSARANPFYHQGVSLLGPSLHLPALSPYLGARSRCVRAALWSAGQGQGSGQLALGDGPGSSSSTVPQGRWAGAGCAARGHGPGSLEKRGTQNQESGP